MASRNLHRRHLKAELWRNLLVKFVAEQPEKSDRAIAAEAGVDHHQVARARKKAEAGGTIVPPEKRVGADGKAQPAKKPAPGKAPKKRPHLHDVDVPRDPISPAPGTPVTVAPVTADPVTCEVPALVRNTEPEPDGELALLREFARFVIGRATVPVAPEDRTEWKALLAQTKATLGIAS